MTVNIPDHAPLTGVSDSLTVDQLRRQLVAMGFAIVANATATTAPNGDVTFERPVGGDKGR